MLETMGKEDWSNCKTDLYELLGHKKEENEKKKKKKLILLRYKKIR